MAHGFVSFLILPQSKYLLVVTEQDIALSCVNKSLPRCAVWEVLYVVAHVECFSLHFCLQMQAESENNNENNTIS